MSQPRRTPSCRPSRPTPRASALGALRVTILTQAGLTQAGLALALVAALALGACGSDEPAGGDDSGTNVGNDAGGDLSLDLPGIDAGEDAGPDGASADRGSEDTEDSGSESTLGAECLASADCSPGEQCIGAGNGSRGYCTILNCRSSDDCDFGDDQVYCCSNYGAGARGCFREAPDAVCGDESGLQGDSCASGGQSDCSGRDAFCIELYGDDICAEFCTPGAADTGCPDGSWCYDTDGRGTGLCVPEGDRDSGSPCADEPAACGAGMFCEGGFESPPDPRAFCATVCESDRDCDEDADEWCRIFPGAPQGSCLPSGDLEEGESCTEDRWGCQPRDYCVNDGTRYAFCAGLCRSQSECDEGYYCNRISGSVGVCWPEGNPDTEPGDPCADEPWVCGENGYCIGGWGEGHNPDAYCTVACDGDESICGADFACTTVESGDYCFPDGEVEARGACETARDCASGTACLYADGDRVGFCAPVCAGDGDCLEGEWCAAVGDEGGYCLPDGDAGQGESCLGDPGACERGTYCGGDPAICFTDCTDDEASCPGDTYCSEPGENGQRICLPAGETALGEACSELYECVEGAFCVGAEEDLEGVCATSCETDADCDGDTWCLRTGSISACLPAGEQTQGESCAGDGGRFSCAPGYICALATTELAHCQAICSGFADRCDEGTVCRYSGGSLNLCAAVGDAEPGDPCVEDPTVCGPDSTCFGAGTDDAYCARLCTFDPEACGEDSECEFLSSGVGLCSVE